MSATASRERPPASPAPAPAGGGGDARAARVVGTLVFLAAVAVGGWLRLRVLEQKPLHSDEGVNGWFLMKLYNGLAHWPVSFDEASGGRKFLGLTWRGWLVNYKYDPTNYHGPFLYFAGLLPFFTLGPSVFSLRLLPALAGTGCIAILWPIRRWLGWSGLALAAWLVALSPPAVYFSRTIIHETYVVFFGLAAFVCLLRSFERIPRGGAPFDRNWLLFGVVSLALVFTNKETSVLTFAVFALAALVAWIGCRPDEPEAPARRSSGLSVAGAAALAVLPVATIAAFADGVQRGTWLPWFAAAGIAGAAIWTTSTRRHRFALEAPWLALVPLARLALWGFLFFVVGPLFLLRWLGRTYGLPLGPVERACGAVERRAPAELEALSDWALAYAWGAALVVILFTSLFKNMRGAVDMFATYLTWVGRGNEGAGHSKPFAYWLELLHQYDLPILVFAALGSLAVLWRRDRVGLFVLVWAWGLWGIYSLISYKTPWLNLNFTVPMALLGGIAAREAARALPAVRARWGGVAEAAFAALAVPVTFLFPVPAGAVLDPAGTGRSATWFEVGWDVNFVHADDDRHRIVYVQTVRDYETMIARLERLFEAEGPSLKVWTTSGDYWPMPFYMRRHEKQVDYYQGKIPSGDPPPVVVASSTQEEALREKLAGYRAERFMLRPGVVLVLYATPEVWDPLFGPPPEPAAVDPAITRDPGVALSPGLIADYRYGIGCTGETLARRVDPVPVYGRRRDDLRREAREFRAPFCARWTGYLRVEHDDEYAFTTHSDDGSWVYLDGALVLDNGGTHGAQARTGVLRRLAPGLHPIEVRYFDAGGGAVLRLDLKRRGSAAPEPLGAMLVHDARRLGEAG